MSWLHLYAAVQLLVTQDSHSGPRVPAGTRSSLRPLSIEGEAIQQSSGEMRREDATACLGAAGWVERSETHHLSFAGKRDGFRKCSTHPTNGRARCELKDQCHHHVIARSPCDEAIQTASAEGFLDCFAPLAMTALKQCRTKLHSRAPDAAQRPGDAEHRPVRCAAEPGPMSQRAPWPAGSRLRAAA
jgi:hypothetical protein